MTGHSMKTYSSYEEWLAEQPTDLLALIDVLSGLVEKTAPELLRSSKWGNAVWLKEKLPLIFIHSKPDHLQLGFFAGTILDDPFQLLKGKAKFVRHIPIFSADFDEQAAQHIIRSAVDAIPYR